MWKTLLILPSHCSFQRPGYGQVTEWYSESIRRQPDCSAPFKRFRFRSPNVHGFAKFQYQKPGKRQRVHGRQVTAKWDLLALTVKPNVRLSTLIIWSTLKNSPRKIVNIICVSTRDHWIRIDCNKWLFIQWCWPRIDWFSSRIKLAQAIVITGKNVLRNWLCGIKEN